jgi:glycosyltransferase involved in cell wall biosynthesis
MAKSVGVIIPAFNEQNAVGKVVNALPKENILEIVVVDNNSQDKTRQAAKEAGATVINETFQGYGAACLCGINYFNARPIKPEVIVFVDADYSDYPEEMSKIVQPIEDNNVHMVIGSRALGNRQSGAMTIPQVFGNWLATRLIRLFFGFKFTDLGPFRAIRMDKLIGLNMQDKTYGWTVEMQVKAIKQGLICSEVPVSYRNRVGVSKISGTVKGTVLAGYKILATIFKYL